MTWANDETGLLVIAGTGKPGKQAKVKPPKPVKAPKPDKKKAAAPSSRPSMPGLPPPREPAPLPLAQGSLLTQRPSVPIGVPIVRAPLRGMTSGASTKVHSRRTTAVESGHPVLRALGVMFLVVVIAAGGFAAGAFTELGTEAETLVLGPTTEPVRAAVPAVDPRVTALEDEVQRLQAELAEERKISIDTQSAPAAQPVVDDAPAKETKKKKHKSRRHRSKGRIDL